LTPARSFRDEDLSMELRGFEPLTPSMPWSFALLADVSGCG
jgi:hypothetical protein